MRWTVDLVQPILSRAAGKGGGRIGSNPTRLHLVWSKSRITVACFLAVSIQHSPLLTLVLFSIPTAIACCLAYPWITFAIFFGFAFISDIRYMINQPSAAGYALMKVESGAIHG